MKENIWISFNFSITSSLKMGSVWAWKCDLSIILIMCFWRIITRRWGLVLYVQAQTILQSGKRAYNKLRVHVYYYYIDSNVIPVPWNRQELKEKLIYQLVTHQQEEPCSPIITCTKKPNFVEKSVQEHCSSSHNACT